MRSYHIGIEQNEDEESGNEIGKNWNHDPFKTSLEEAVNLQIGAGIDIISDGQTRNDMVSLFAGKLKGIRMKERPVVIGPLEFREPITLDDLRLARKLAGGRCMVKGIITGAYTMARSCVDEHYGNVEELAYAFAEVLDQEARAISGTVDMIQVDEPFFSVDYPEYGKELVGMIMKGVEVDKALHVCGDVAPVFEELMEMDVNILDHEFAAHENLANFVAGFDFPQKIGYGCVRSDVNEAESIDIVKERIKKVLDLFGDDKLLLDPDCGLRNLDKEVAVRKLKNMVEARDLIEKECEVLTCP